MTLKSRPTATPHRLMMHCTYWWFFILLHRPFYHRRQRPIHSSDREIDHVKVYPTFLLFVCTSHHAKQLCKRAAENIVELLGTWRSLYSLRYSPITLVQTAFSAGTIYLLVAVQAATGLRVANESLKHSLSQAHLCVQYLLEIGKSWQCATNIADILKNLLQEQLKPLLDRRAIQQIHIAGKEVYAPPAKQSVSPRSSSRPAPPRKRQPSSTRTSRTRPSPPVESPTSTHSDLSQNQQMLISPPSMIHPISPAASTSSTFAFHDTWNLGGSSSSSIPLTHGNSPESYNMPYFQSNPGMDPSSGFLAMLGGEPLSNAPFLPTFSRVGYSTGHEDSPMQDVDALAYSGSPQVSIPDSELAVLEQFWSQHFS